MRKHITRDTRYAMRQSVSCLATALLGIMTIAATARAAETKAPTDEQKAFLQSILPADVPAPKPTEAQAERGFIHYWADPTVNFFTNMPPVVEDLDRQPIVRTPAGEDEPLLLGVWGLRRMHHAALWVLEPVFETTVWVVSDPGEREIMGMAKLGIPYFLEPDGEPKIESEHNVFFWINVNVPADAKPGTYTGKFALTVSEQPWSEGHKKHNYGHRIELPFMVEVLPIKLPRADVAFGMYFRPLGQWMAPQYCTPELMRAYYRDMARHGQTSATMYVYERLVDDQGNLFLDGKRTTRRMEMMREAGLIHPDIPFMWLGSGGLEWETEERAREHSVTMRAEFERRSWPEPLWYGPDEPSTPEEDAERSAGARSNFDRMAALRPTLRIVTAISSQAAAHFADDLDVWVVHNPNIDVAVKELAEKHGAEFWTYDCRHRGTNPTWNRYYPGLFTWAYGLKGNFLWCYSELYTWESTRGAALVWVLPSRFGPIPSVGWETRREGIEDYRYLSELEKLCRIADEAKAEQVKQWLAELRNRVLAPGKFEKPLLPYWWDRFDLWTQCPQFARGELTQIRNQAIRFMLELQAP